MVVSTIAGSGVSGAANGLGTVAAFMMPSGVTGDTLGNLFISDASANSIRQIQTGDTCSAGLYFDGSNCASVPAGYYSTGEGVYYACAAGYYSSSTGSSACSFCNGRFSSPGSSSCSLSACMTGYYLDSSSICQVCLAGSYSLGGTSNVCTLSPAGAWFVRVLLAYICVAY